MLVQTAIVALLAAAPALVHATPAPTTKPVPASGTSREETLVKIKSVISSIKEKQTKSHRCVHSRIQPVIRDYIYLPT